MFDRESVSRGHAVFYTIVYPEMKRIAADNGWALGLHGSLVNDMDIMAMPWTEEAIEADELMKKFETLFADNGSPFEFIKNTTDKPNGRIVYTILIYNDYYCDINIINHPLCKSEKSVILESSRSNEPYFVESDDIDINPARMRVYWGGNGDIYVTIYDNSGIHGVRLRTSGGNPKELGIRIKLTEVAREFLKLEK